MREDSATGHTKSGADGRPRERFYLCVTPPHPDDWPSEAGATVLCCGRRISREEAAEMHRLYHGREVVVAVPEDPAKPRERLKRLVDEIAAAAKERIDDPKNVAKGDHWRDLTWGALLGLRLGEEIEFAEATEDGGSPSHALHEAGDYLACIAMALDKHRGNGGSE